MISVLCLRLFAILPFIYQAAAVFTSLTAESSSEVPNASTSFLFTTSYSGLVHTLRLTKYTLHSNSQTPQYTLTKLHSTDICGPNPSWLILDSPRNLLYCTEPGVATNTTAAISTLQIQKDGSLISLGKINTPIEAAQGVLYGPERNLAIAYYAGSSTGFYIAHTNTTNPLSELTTLHTTSPPNPSNPVEQDTSHPHGIIALPFPLHNYVLVPDYGSDIIRVFLTSPTNVTELTNSEVKIKQSSGPRHGVAVVLGDGQMMVFVLSEIAVSLTIFKVWENGTGHGLQWEMVQEVDMRVGLGGRYRGGIVLGSEIAVTENNAFLIASLRNDSSFSIHSPINSSENIKSDSLLTYSISPTTGLLKLVDEAAAGGSYPRQFSLNKGNDLVAVAEQYDGNVAILKRDVKTGKVGGSVAAVGEMGSGRQEGVVQVIWWE